MSTCEKCGKELGVLSHKHKSDDGVIWCDTCFEKWEQEQSIKKVEVMVDFLTRYITDKNEAFRARFVGLNRLKNAEMKEHWNDYDQKRSA